MSDSNHDGSSLGAPVEAKSEVSLSSTSVDAPTEGIVVVVRMRPERILAGLTAEGKKAKKGKPAKPAAGVDKEFRTSNWYFAADFLDRLAEISSGGCGGFSVRPVQVEVTFALDEKAYRHVDLILDSFTDAYRAI